MRPAGLVYRDLARRDAEGAVDFYLAEAGEAVALRFVAALEEAYDFIRRSPGAGSPRYGHELDLPGLRSRPLKGFPDLIFYVEGARPEVWRVLHAQQDIPARLQPPEDKGE